jgi:UDP-glucose-4-epimerase GalE
MQRPPRVIVAGGAGYIGSHMAAMLQGAGFEAVVVDDLSTGHADAVPGLAFEQGRIGDAGFMRSVLARHEPVCVMHFAAFSIVADSVTQRERYWRNNVDETQELLDTMLAAGVDRFIFSSSAAVYGNPVQVPITETHPCAPINPYGETKLVVESRLRELEASGLRSISLRYFNAAGAHPDGVLGERHEPETHLIPLVLQVASGRREVLSRFGTELPTRDGSCIRDYVHVQDLCEAHLLALKRLLSDGASGVFNLGSGTGHSVTEVIEAARRVTGRPIPVKDEPPRPGDPPVLVADASLARGQLGWTPRYPGLETMIRHAWQWELARGGGR